MIVQMRLGFLAVGAMRLLLFDAYDGALAALVYVLPCVSLECCVASCCEGCSGLSEVCLLFWAPELGWLVGGFEGGLVGGGGVVWRWVSLVGCSLAYFCGGG